MSGYEVERLDWLELSQPGSLMLQIRGVPVRVDEKMGTGRFRLVCDVEHSPATPSGVGSKVAA